MESLRTYAKVISAGLHTSPDRKKNAGMNQPL